MPPGNVLLQAERFGRSSMLNLTQCAKATNDYELTLPKNDTTYNSFTPSSN